MKIKNPELLKIVRAQAKKEIRRMNAEERAELEKRSGQSMKKSAHARSSTRIAAAQPKEKKTSK